MITEKDLTCIVCPVGCIMHVVKDDQDITVTGNACKRGEKYAIDEMTAPKRMVTSSIAIIGGDMPLASVKTSEAVPKEKIDEILREIRITTVKAPVKIGEALIRNIADTGADILATRNVNE